MSYTDAERAALAAKLESDLDEFIAQQTKISEKKRKETQEPEQTLDELVDELKGHPAFMTELDPTKPLHPLVEGLQALKYNSDDARDNADGYKDDGNNNFKLKKYRWAIDAYTEGIKIKCADKLLNAQLYSNRAASHFFLGNYRTSFIDCVLARKFKPDHTKAMIKGIQCSMARQRYDDAILWCDDVLLLCSTDQKVLDMRCKCEKLKKQQERDRRKAIAKERKAELAQKQLIQVLKDRGVRLACQPVDCDDDNFDPIMLSSLESCHPSGAKVHVDESGRLQWPVMFLYPEYGQSDFIEKFSEVSCFDDHLSAMFGQDAESPPWDADHKYKQNTLQIYFEEKKEEKLYRVESTSTLAMALKNEKLIVQAGTPAFILLVKDSEFATSFIKKYANN